jgi:hypothetical protein
MGMPDQILLTPDKLTDEEWVIMRKHPELAYQLLSPIQYLQEALDIPYCHHEKWDGTGHPRGLKGNEIPFSAQNYSHSEPYFCRDTFTCRFGPTSVQLAFESSNDFFIIIVVYSWLIMRHLSRL